MSTANPPTGPDGAPVLDSDRHRNATCSFCRKRYQEVGPVLEGPGGIYICAHCVDLFQDIIDQEKCRRWSGGDPLAYLRFKIERVEKVLENMKTAMDPQVAAFWGPGPAPPPQLGENWDNP